MSQFPAITFRNVSFAYGEDQSARSILDGIDIDIPKGQLTALMGASGGGKTTVLRLISGQCRASSGEVNVLGHDIAKLSHKQLYTARRQMGMLFQFGALFTDMSVFDNVAFPLREHTQLPEVMVRDIVLIKLNAVGLRGARDLMPAEISGGMARRVALARAIALDPALMMYDEPFAGLDPISLGTAAKLIRELNDALGMTSIVVSQDVQETLGIAQHVVILADGKVAVQGTPDEIRNCTNPLVQQFISGDAEGPVRFHYPAQPVREDLLGQANAHKRAAT